jgi:eukaryotic-like serine/threonine-protein kinase
MSPDTAPTIAAAAAVAEPASIRPAELADHLLALLLRGQASSALFEPRTAGTHRVTLGLRGGTIGAFTLGDGLGDSILARLALLAGLDLLRPASQAGTARIALDDDEAAEVVVTTRPTEHGLGGELRLFDEPVTELADLGGPELLPPGTRVGAFVIESMLGRGGMGVVYAAEHPVLRRPFAIKVLLREVLTSDPSAARRFVREAQAAARIRHPGIVDVTDFGTLPDGRPYIVMERLPGTSLGDLVAQAGALEPQRAVALARRIAEALEAAHAAGVIHRDLTPGNVFVLGSGDDERVVLLDFGAATTKDPEHLAVPDGPPGMVVGTPNYIAPEVAQGLEVDGRGDVYALGVILFEMLAGQVPYVGKSPMDVVLKHVRAPVPPATSPFGPLPEELGRVIRCAMSKKPDDRYASMAALLGDLGRIEPQLRRAGWRRWLPL